MTRLLNTGNAYGAVPIAIHWLSVAVIIGMFCLGFWMVDLDYYDSWYRRAPDIHKSVGILFAVHFERQQIQLNQLPPALTSRGRITRIDQCVRVGGDFFLDREVMLLSEQFFHQSNSLI